MARLILVGLFIALTQQCLGWKQPTFADSEDDGSLFSHMNKLASGVEKSVKSKKVGGDKEYVHEWKEEKPGYKSFQTVVFKPSDGKGERGQQEEEFEDDEQFDRQFNKSFDEDESENTTKETTRKVNKPKNPEVDRTDRKEMIKEKPSDKPLETDKQAEDEEEEKATMNAKIVQQKKEVEAGRARSENRENKKKTKKTRVSKTRQENSELPTKVKEQHYEEYAVEGPRKGGNREIVMKKSTRPRKEPLYYVIVNDDEEGEEEEEEEEEDSSPYDYENDDTSDDYNEKKVNYRHNSRKHVGKGERAYVNEKRISTACQGYQKRGNFNAKPVYWILV